MIVWYCFAFVLFMPLFLAIGSIPFRVSQFGAPDFNNPRPQADRLQGAGERIVYAQKNAWEALVLFTGTLLLVTANGIPLESIATACVVFVCARIAHAAFYILGFGVLRFLAFAIGLGSLITIIYRVLT